MTALLAMLILGAVSWVFRIAFITLLPAERLPARVQTALDHLAPAVLASIVAVELVTLLAVPRLPKPPLSWQPPPHHRNRLPHPQSHIACALGLCTVLALHYLTV